MFSLKEKYPELAASLHPDLNEGLTAEEITPGSHKIVRWKCPKGHVWDRPVCRQVRSRKCPVCIGRKVMAGFNDLKTTHPELAEEWHASKNDSLEPSQVSKGSTKKVWWQCSVDPEHEWQSTVNNRTNLGRGCPVCVGQKRLKGFNDLFHTHPEIASTWHPTLNGELTPSDVGKGSINLVWWQCDLGHAWKTSPNNRIKQGCPFCSGKKVLPGFNDLDTTHSSLAKEWHPTKNLDLTPNSVSHGSGKKIRWICRLGHEWSASCGSRSSGHGCPVCEGQAVAIGQNDLESTNEQLSHEWHKAKNGNLTPQMVTAGSDRKVWWLGPCGHEWQASIGHRARGGGCPICGNDIVVPGINDLSTTHPEIANEWHPSKNGNLTPKAVSAGNNEKFWWKGVCGHEWSAILANRARLHAGCPYCSGVKVLPGFNDLGTRRPELAAEWHPTLNGSLKPQSVSPGSKLSVWWKGQECGHVWQQRVNQRSRGHGCVVCWKPWSLGEKQIVKFIESEYPTLQLRENFRGDFLGLLELDIFLEEIHLGIEFNGNYWHDESRDPSIRERHLRKLRLCEQAGVRLAVVWEEDWRNRQEEAKSEIIKIIEGATPPCWMRMFRS